MLGAHRGQKRASYLLELELRTVVSHDVGAGYLTGSSTRATRFLITETFFQTIFSILKDISKPSYSGLFFPIIIFNF